MSTLNQLISLKRKKKQRKSKVPALNKCPQKKGICIRAFLTNPKKPNSAVRKVARLTLSTGRRVTAYIAGKGGHNIQKHSAVLVRGGRVRDLPGVRYKIVRGKYDLNPVPRRVRARSKYGIKK
jgi:small subunit ribosomal protein S12